MSQPRRMFDDDFKAGAIRIVEETRRPVAEVARELGINDWNKPAKTDTLE